MSPNHPLDAEIKKLAKQMVTVPGGRIILKEERTARKWRVELNSFLLDPFPVTQELYFAVTKKAPFTFTGDHLPAEGVSWIEAVRFCNALSRKANLSECYAVSDDSQDVQCDWEADGYRLPSEGEWEFACRAGNEAARYGVLDNIAWYYDNAGKRPHTVGQKEPNDWGLYDMLGNVWEWCWDRYDEKIYGPYRVFRGGGWYDPGNSCRASCRRKSHPTYQMDDLGFRLARSLPG